MKLKENNKILISFQKIINKYCKYTVYDIAISSIFLAIYLGLIFLLRLTVLHGKLNIQFEYIIFIVYGIVLGPFKGVVLAIIADTLNLLIRGLIPFWTIEYAIVPPLVVIVSWLLMFFYNKKNIKNFIILSLFVVATMTLMLSVFIFELIQPVDKTIDKTFKKIFNKSNITILLICFFVVFLGGLIVLSLLWWKTKNEIYYLIFFIISIIFIINVIFRWLWGPFAFIKYYNRFIAKKGSAFDISDKYYIYFAPIILKGVITIPLYTAFLVPTIPFLMKYNNYKIIKKIKWY
ncbi:ECF transporter S component [Mesomycoplasma neurolyticum]|uniref:ECF transporter S component n=1 Tax=Mesomycoplasma neurolyticum TaxID=2120 RepID=A0A449A484_9BACT|nr:ECF transporter S component [Mesomycoplasma neurolyticum]VEU59090.1 Uncharacterised protein [Mesomycoplasma neurolyticum]